MLHFPRFPFATRGKFDRSRRSGNVRWSIEAVCLYAPKLRPTLNHTARRMYTHSPQTFSFLRKPEAQPPLRGKPYFRIALFSPLYFSTCDILRKVVGKKINKYNNKITFVDRNGAFNRIPFGERGRLEESRSILDLIGWRAAFYTFIDFTRFHRYTPFPDIARLHVFRCNRKT